MDIFDELNGYSSNTIPPVPRNTPVNQCYKGHHYSAPSNKDARQIWDECEFGLMEGRRTIEHIVRAWALQTAALQGDYICWTSNTDVTYKSTWSTFLKWFLLCCNKVR